MVKTKLEPAPEVLMPEVAFKLSFENSVQILRIELEKSRLQEMMNLWTDADSITIAMKRKKNLMGDLFFFKCFKLKKKFNRVSYFL